ELFHFLVGRSRSLFLCAGCRRRRRSRISLKNKRFEFIKSRSLNFLYDFPRNKTSA
ncbi:unnamed protein product, partial [Amoebophrya sp. A120]